MILWIAAAYSVIGLIEQETKPLGTCISMGLDKSMRGTVKEGDKCPISSLQAEFNVIPDALKNLIADISNYEIDLLARVLEEGKADGNFVFSWL